MLNKFGRRSERKGRRKNGGGGVVRGPREKMVFSFEFLLAERRVIKHFANQCGQRFKRKKDNLFY